MALSFVTKDTSDTHTHSKIKDEKKSRLTLLPSQNEATRIFRGLATNLNSRHAAVLRRLQRHPTHIYIFSSLAQSAKVLPKFSIQSHFILKNRKQKNENDGKPEWNAKFYTFLIWKPFFHSLPFLYFSGSPGTTKPWMIKTIKR